MVNDNCYDTADGNRKGYDNGNGNGYETFTV